MTSSALPTVSSAPSLQTSGSLTSDYTSSFLSFLTDNPTVFHAVHHFAHRLSSHGFTQLSERELWTSKVKKGGKYYVQRNGSSLIAFIVGDKYEAGNGAAIVAGHIDALTAKRKDPFSVCKETHETDSHQ